MGLADSRAGTQDNSSGTPFPTGANEDGGARVPTAILVGNKTTFSEATARTGITGADAPTGGDLTTTGFAGSAGANLFALGNALAVQVRATCNTASKTLTGRLMMYDGSNNFLYTSEPISFTSDATLRLGNGSGDFVCQRPQVIDVGPAVRARFFVDSVSGGTWAINCRPI